MSDTNKNVYILFEHRMIEDYYRVRSVAGVYSSREEAEKAIDELEVVFKARLIDRYWADNNREDKKPEYWETKKHELEKSLARKQEGSNAWKGVKREYEKVLQTLADGSYAKQETFEQWHERRNWVRFAKDQYSVVEVELGKFLNQPEFYL